MLGYGTQREGMSPVRAAWQLRGLQGTTATSGHREPAQLSQPRGVSRGSEQFFPQQLWSHGARYHGLVLKAKRAANRDSACSSEALITAWSNAAGSQAERLLSQAHTTAAWAPPPHLHQCWTLQEWGKAASLPSLIQQCLHHI